jgi:hypothetical protein
MIPPRVLAAFALLATAGPALAHHGVAAVGIGGPDGPAAALETTSPLPLPERTFFAMAKSELVPFRARAIAAPENKSFSSFSTLGAGYGATPWLSAYLFLPLAVKSQDVVGTNRALGDPSVLVALGAKWDEGLRLVPERESLDELTDWHFSAWASSTIPVGSTTRRDRSGAYFAPDMQAGFGAPSPAAGIAVMKQVSERVTLLADGSYQHFFAHRYPFTRYRFGGETRLNGAAAWQAYGRGPLRVDVVGELNGLRLQRDREASASGRMEALEASGGAILYAGAGLRLTRGALAATLGVKRAALRDLNEERAQQGSEGLEALRAAVTLSWTRAL